jgi:site-specific recombinase XerD
MARKAKKNNQVQVDELFFSKTRDFLNVYLPKQAGKSICTIKSYTDTLRVFRNWVNDRSGMSEETFKFDECDPECILAFMDSLKKDGCSPNTRNQRLAALKSYLSFAADKDITILPISLAARTVKGVRAHTPVRDMLTEEEMAAIISQPAGTPRGLRDRTLFAVMYDSACRLDEILSLTMDNVSANGSDPCIQVLGKGDKERIVSINPITGQLIQKYDKFYRGFGKAGTDLLFYTVSKGMPGKMSERNVELMLKKYADKARKICPGIPESVYPHMLRRTRATHLYQDGLALPLISKILGHEHLETTKIYAVPSTDMMRGAMDAAIAEAVKGEEPLWIIDEDESARKRGSK